MRFKGVQLPESSRQRGSALTWGVWGATWCVHAPLSLRPGYVVGSIRALLSENGAPPHQGEPRRRHHDRRSAQRLVWVSTFRIRFLGFRPFPIIIPPWRGHPSLPELVLYDASNKQASRLENRVTSATCRWHQRLFPEPLVGTLLTSINIGFCVLLQINFTDIPRAPPLLIVRSNRERSHVAGFTQGSSSIPRAKRLILR